MLHLVNSDDLTLLRGRVQARVIMIIVILDAKRSDGGNLRDVFAGLRPVKMRGLGFVPPGTFTRTT
jgi:hypothetical protein